MKLLSREQIKAAREAATSPGFAVRLGAAVLVVLGYVSLSVWTAHPATTGGPNTGGGGSPTGGVAVAASATITTTTNGGVVTPSVADPLWVNEFDVGNLYGTNVFFFITNAPFLATDGNGQVVKGTSLAATLLTGTLQAAQMPALTGDVTTPGGSLATTLATVNASPGTYGDSTHVPQLTVNGKGLITAVSSVVISGGGGSGTVGTTNTTFYIWTNTLGVISFQITNGIVLGYISNNILYWNTNATFANGINIGTSSITNGVGSTNAFAFFNPSQQLVVWFNTNGVVGLGTNGQFVLDTSGNLTITGIFSGNGHSLVDLDYSKLTNAPANTVMGRSGSAGAVQALTTIPTATMPALTGDVTTPGGSLASTLATVNANVGTFGDASHSAQVTLNGKGLSTGASSVVISIGDGNITGTLTKNTSGSSGSASNLLAYVYATNETGTTTLVCDTGLSYFTNLAAANVTIAAITVNSNAMYGSCVYWATNTSGADRTITLPTGVRGPPGSGNPAVFTATNNMLTELLVQHHGTKILTANVNYYGP